MVADMVDEALEILLFDDEVDRGPGLGCTSPEQNNNMFSHKANTMAYKQVAISETNLVFAIVDFPRNVSLRE